MKALLIAVALLGIAAAADTTTYQNRYNLYGLAAGTTSVSNTASASFPVSVDTKLYLGDHYTGDYAPGIDADFGLTFTGQQLAMIRASFLLSSYSSWI